MSSSHQKRQRSDGPAAAAPASRPAETSIADLRATIEGLDPRRARQLQGQVGNAALNQILAGQATEEVLARAQHAATRLAEQQAREHEEEQEEEREQEEAEQQEAQRLAAADLAPTQSTSDEPPPGADVIDAVVRMAADLLFDGEEDEDDDDDPLGADDPEPRRNRRRDRWLPERSDSDEHLTPGGRSVRRAEARGDERTSTVWCWLQEPAALVEPGFELDHLLDAERVPVPLKRISKLAAQLERAARSAPVRALLRRVGPLEGPAGLAPLVARSAALIELAIVAEPGLCGVAALSLEPSRGELELAARQHGLGVRATSLQLVQAAASSARDASPVPCYREAGGQALAQTAKARMAPRVAGFPFPTRRAPPSDPIERALAGPDPWEQPPVGKALDTLVRDLGGVLEGLLAGRKEVAAAALAVWRTGGRVDLGHLRRFEAALQPLGRSLVVHAERVAGLRGEKLSAAEPHLRAAVEAGNTAGAALQTLRAELLAALVDALPEPTDGDVAALDLARDLVAAGEGRPDRDALLELRRRAEQRHNPAAWACATIDLAHLAPDPAEQLRAALEHPLAASGAVLRAHLLELGQRRPT